MIDAGRPLVFLQEALRAGRCSLPEILDEHLSSIAICDKKIGSFLCVMEQEARERAGRLQGLIDRQRWPGPLCGLVVAVKDNICVADHPATAGSRILEGFRPLYDATAIGRLEQAGAILIGKTNLDEFGMGSSTEHSAFGPTRNPYDPSRVPGGSSGGSAAAVAAGMCSAALGSDTGGSVRQPAAYCGVVGLKPQYGSVSRRGLIAFASSMDGIGPLAPTGADCSLIFEVISGLDLCDATTVDLEGAPRAGAIRRVGLPRGWIESCCTTEIKDAFEGCARRIESCGFTLTDIDLPDPDWAAAAYYILATAEASSNLARYDGIHYGPATGRSEDLGAHYRKTRGAGFGPEVKRRILLGTHVLSAGHYQDHYEKAQRVRTAWRQSMDALFDEVGAILLPTTPESPFLLGERLDDPVRMYRSDLFTIGPNLTGYPAVSFPIGATRAGLPVGAQLWGPAFSERALLAIADQHGEGQPFGPLQRRREEMRMALRRAPVPEDSPGGAGEG